MKALEKDRNRRYESSSAFGADVQRFLDDEPVLACPPSVAYRVKKLMRRHRVLLTTGMLLPLLNDRPRDRTCRETLAGNYLSLGVLAGWAGQYGQELEFEKQGMEIARGLVQDYPTDQDGIPTLVEVKRGSNAQVRREVVGQLLDYAACELSYRPQSSLTSRRHPTPAALCRHIRELILRCTRLL